VVITQKHMPEIVLACFAHAPAEDIAGANQGFMRSDSFFSYIFAVIRDKKAPIGPDPGIPGGIKKEALPCTFLFFETSICIRKSSAFSNIISYLCLGSGPNQCLNTLNNSS
jgi:hypothetical protein